MTPRRLLITPLLVLLAGMMVLISIQLGERARAITPAVAAPVSSDPALRDEQSRMDTLRTALTRCTEAEPCTGAAGAERLRVAAATVDDWPFNPKLRELRTAFQLDLRLQADVLELTALADLDGVRSEDDHVRLTRATDASYAAARDLIYRRLDAKLDPKSELLANLQRNSALRSEAIAAIRG